MPVLRSAPSMVLARLFWAAWALAVALLLPGLAKAAIIPVCDDEPGITALPEPMCTIVTVVDDETGETQAAPLCDITAASTIAPLRVHPVSDASIEAAPCGSSLEASDPTSRPWEPGVSQPKTLADMTVNPVADLPQVVYVVTLLDFADAAGGPRRGIAHDVFHPPRR